MKFFICSYFFDFDFRRRISMRKKTVVLLREGEKIEKSNSQIEPGGGRWKTSASTPQLCLPKIGVHAVSKPISGMESVDKLESYIHHLIAHRHQQTLLLKKQKKIKEDFQARKENQTKNENLEKKMLKKRRIHDLEERLKELRGEVSVQEKKLQIENSIQDRMMVQYKQYYDNLHNRVRGVVKQDESAQTEEITTNVQTQQSASSVHSEVNIKVPGHYKRKFRIAAYAVYFSLAFPKYVRAFREIRKKYFFQNIVRSQQLAAPIQNYFKLLSSFKLAELQRERERISRRNSGSAPSFSFQEIDEEGNNKIKTVPLDSIVQMVVFLLKKIKDNLVQGQLDPLLKVLSFYLTSKSFLSDDFFLIDQLYRLRVDPNTLELSLEKFQSRQLLLNFLISKLTCFNFMIVGNKENRKLIKRNSKIAKEHQTESLTRSLLLGGLFLFKKCNESFFDAQLQEKMKKRGNIQLLDHDVFPVPMKQLEISQKFDLTNPGQGSRKRTSIESMINFAGLNVPGIKYKNMSKSLEMLENFNTNHQHSQEIQLLLTDIGELAYEKCWKARVDHFNIIQQSAILHPNLLTSNIQCENYVRKKLPNQKSFIEACLPLIERARTEVPRLQASQKSLKSSAKRIEASKRSIVSSKSNPTSSRQSGLNFVRGLTNYEVASHQKMIFDQNSSNTMTAKRSEKSEKVSHLRHRGTQSGEIKIGSQKSESSNGTASPVIRLTELQRSVLRNRLKDATQEINKR